MGSWIILKYVYKEVFRCRKSKDSQYNDQIKKKTTVEQNNGPQTLHRKVKIKQHESL